MVETSEQVAETNPSATVQSLSVSEVFPALGTSRQGLTGDQVAEHTKKYGLNTIREAKGTPLIIKFLANFTHMMAILLWVGGILALFAQMPQLAIAVWLVNVINGAFSFMQEFRAEKATEALKKLLPSYARVIRDGEEQKILAEELVPGDVILLEEGDKISADARLIEQSDLQTDQSTLTGESRAVNKTADAVLRADLAHTEMPNLIFAGTNVAAGTGKAVVFATGMNTEFGKIAGLTQNIKNEESPLQKEMGRVTKIVSFIAVGIGLLFFLLAAVFTKTNITENFIFTLGMIVAFVPEGLLPTVTLSLAMGVQRMAKRHALIKRLSAVETLGCTTVICTDKTGTLTQNEMTVSHLWMGGTEFNVTGVGYAPEGSILDNGKPVTVAGNGDLYRLLTGSALCNNARLVPPDSESPRYTVLGDPTEAAMIVAAGKGGIDLTLETRQNQRLRELPFESRRKRMSTIHLIPNPTTDANRIAYIKGAPKEVIDLCTSIRMNGKEEEMTQDQRSRLMDINDGYARKGLRVLAVAMRLISQDSMPGSLSSYTPELVEQNMTFLGLVAMADPPRPEVAAAVEECRHAGIRIIMITGDYGLTAESIARHIGIIKGDHPKIFTGLELEGTDDETLKEALKDEVIFARVAPEQKLRVVSALQEMGHIVAVTGDGVNDSPALKKADIGVAMGMAGTDVAKEAADMILTDDNFASIVHAVEEGRAVYNNIRKFATYILNSNMPEAVPFIFYIFSGGMIPLPLTLMQILSIDLGTDMVPAIALGAEHPEAGSMDRPPRPQKEPLLSKKLLVKAMLWYGMIESAVAMLAFFFLYWMNGWRGGAMAGDGNIYFMATTMSLAAIIFSQIGMVFNCRTDLASVFKVGIFKNKMVLVGIATELILLLLMIYTPFLQGLFNTAPIGWQEWMFLMAIPPVIVGIEEIRKFFARKRHHLEKNRITG